MKIIPVILGSGRSGRAIAMSLANLNLRTPELNIASPVWASRGVPLALFQEKYENSVLFIANPHALHSKAILEAWNAGFKAIVCEKPSCVNLEQLQMLNGVQTSVAILHVYRQMWGPQTLKTMLDEELFGEMISVEGKYWQSSTAERSLKKEQSKPLANWKSDPQLSGDFDTYLDLGTHWVDMASFLLGSAPNKMRGWRSMANSEAPHRDSHVHIEMDFVTGVKAFTSVSKTFHGATNEFEINVIGSKKSARWTFLNPDEIIIGEGRDRRIVTRSNSDLGSRLPPFHGLGWSEGYIEVISQILGEVFLGMNGNYPKLKENLEMMNAILNIEWVN